ncbi:MAG: haloacid dehalogenase [Cyanobacteria bacterium RYN_339]|nr:haloacid dehalogenase [Cyanobacteria bacterium RYN_339]
MPPKAILFDCDGVLIDSEVLACGVQVRLLAEAGVDVTLERYMAAFIGRPNSEVLAELAVAGLPADFRERAAAETARVFERELRAMAGAAVVLAGLALPIAVASTSRPERLAHSLGLTGLLGYFGRHVYSATMVARGKPAPDLFLLAARELGVAPADCWVVEDSLVGVQAAVAAGMTPIGFLGGSHVRAGHGDRLIAAGAVAVVSSFEGIPSLLC